MSKAIFEKEFYDTFFRSLNLEQNDSICIAFSGGVDSSLLVSLCKKKWRNISLISVSFDTREIEYAKWASRVLNAPLLIANISLIELENGIEETIRLIDYDRIALLENAIGYFFVFKHASSNNFMNVLSANGLDEQFCGYDIYKKRYFLGGIEELILDLTNKAKEDQVEIEKVSNIFGVTYLCPFLEDNFIEYSEKLPLSLKILDEKDNLRKHLVRKMASLEGLPSEIVNRYKKSLQYSTGLHKSIRRLARKNGFTNKKGRQLGFESGMKAYIASIEKRIKKDL
jgi:asparagine synthase (glutamine-hydrolysing)